MKVVDHQVVCGLLVWVANPNFPYMLYGMLVNSIASAGIDRHGRRHVYTPVGTPLLQLGFRA